MKSAFDSINVVPATAQELAHLSSIEDDIRSDGNLTQFPTHSDYPETWTIREAEKMLNCLEKLMTGRRSVEQIQANIEKSRKTAAEWRVNNPNSNTAAECDMNVEIDEMALCCYANYVK